MPLPPLPFNNTDIAWLKYTSYGVTHELMFRQPSVTPQADIIANAVDIANTLKVYIPSTDAFVGLRHQDSGSNVSFPLAWTAISGTGAAATEFDDKAKFVSVVGRSLGGYRCRMTFFSPYPSDNGGYRVPAGNAGIYAAMLAVVAGMEPPAVAIDGNEVIWNQYTNVGYNAYWQRQLRKFA